MEATSPANDVSTSGDYAIGELIQSIGAGGGANYVIGGGNPTLNITLGATDGSTGNGGSIQLINQGDMRTAGDMSHGFVLQSIGGGGGLTLTDLDAVTVNPSDNNGGNGGPISFTNVGDIYVSGEGGFGVLLQSLGGGGGFVDDAYFGSTGGAGMGGAISLDQSGNISAASPGGIAVMAQSEGIDGQDTITISIDGVVIGGTGPQAGAIDIRGGTINEVSISSDSFVLSRNMELLRGGEGDDRLLLDGVGIGNVDLGGGTNSLIVGQSGELIALELIDLGEDGVLDIAGKFTLGGEVLLAGEPLFEGSGLIQKQDPVFNSVDLENLSPDDLNVVGLADGPDLTIVGSVNFQSTSTFSRDIYFDRENAWTEPPMIMNVSGDFSLSGEVDPNLVHLGQARPFSLLSAGGDLNATGAYVDDTWALDYELETGVDADGNEVLNLVFDPRFERGLSNRNATNLGDYLNDMLEGTGSTEWGDVLALLGGMTDGDEFASLMDKFNVGGFAETQAEVLYASLRNADRARECNASSTSFVTFEKTCYWMGGQEDTYERLAGENPALTRSAAGLAMGRIGEVRDRLQLGLVGGVEYISLNSGEDFTAQGVRYEGGANLTQRWGGLTTFSTLTASNSIFGTERIIDISGTLSNGSVFETEMAEATQSIAQLSTQIGTQYRQDVPLFGIEAEIGFALDGALLRSFGAEETGVAYGVDLLGTNQAFLNAIPSYKISAQRVFTPNIGIKGFVKGLSYASLPSDIFINAKVNGSDPVDGFFRHYAELDKVRHNFELGLSLFQPNETFYLDLDYSTDLNPQFNNRSAAVSVGFRF